MRIDSEDIRERLQAEITDRAPISIPINGCVHFEVHALKD